MLNIKLSKFLLKSLRNVSLLTVLFLSHVTYAEPIKAAFIFIGPAESVGWSYSHNEGRKFLEQKLGDQIETEFVEFVPEGRASRKVLQDLAAKNDIVFATSVGYMVSIDGVSKDHPTVKFENAGGSRQADNLTTYATRAYQPRYLSGLIAGSMTKTNKIGYVAGHPIPEVIRGINAFTLGVREANPDAVVEVEWAKAWYAPEKEASLAHKLILSGADVLTHHTDSSAVVEEAEKQGVYSIGYHADMSKLSPEHYLASVVHNWGPYYEKRIQALVGAQWATSDEWMGMKDKTSLLLTENNRLPAHLSQMVSEKEAALIAGTLDVFAGPIKNHRGRVRIKEGRQLSDDKLLRMNWYVEGVTGSLLSF